MSELDREKGRRITLRRTICEVHRQLYDHCIVDLQDRPEIRDAMALLIEEAYVLGIKMDNKLHEYKFNIESHTPVNNIEAVSVLRARRIELTGD